MDVPVKGAFGADGARCCLAGHDAGIYAPHRLIQKRGAGVSENSGKKFFGAGQYVLHGSQSGICEPFPGFFPYAPDILQKPCAHEGGFFARFNHGQSVGFRKTRGDFCQIAVGGNAHRNGKPCLVMYPLFEQQGCFAGSAENSFGTAHVEEGFVNGDLPYVR